MLVRKIVHTLCGVVLLGVLATSVTGASFNTSRTTHFTFSRAVQLPGVTLPAGTYTFEVVNANSGSDVVSVTSRDRSKVYLMRIHASRLPPVSGHTQGEHYLRRNRRRHAATRESVVSGKRDPRPRVRLLTTHLYPRRA